MSNAENRNTCRVELEQVFRLATEAVAQLAVKERGVFVRLYFQKIPIKDVAIELGLSAADVIDLAAKAISKVSSRLDGVVNSQAFDPENNHYRATLEKAGFDQSRIDELAPLKPR